MDRQELKESALRTGAILTAAGAAFLGRVGVMPAMAMPEAKSLNTPEHIDTTRKPKPAPEGVRVLHNETAIQMENLKAYINLKHRWNGVVVLHAPKTDANVGFASSPSAYDVFQTGTGFLYHDDKHVEQVNGPGIEKFNGRTYLAVAGEGSHWGWADLKWLMENKAIDFYEYAGSTPKPVSYNPAQSATRGVPKLQSWDTKPSMYQTFDMNSHLHHLKPSKVVPYVKK
ncbi:hypothetical protein KW794_00150 [Candidatus Saccharibacteria bacterium]|nr:hypothetical protein [Candidatus Saccharibacteria bacterium]